MPQLGRDYTTQVIDGEYARLVTHANSPKDLGCIHEYLWKTFLPEHKLKPKTGDQDFCMQIYHKNPTDPSADQVNEVLVPIEGAFVQH